MGLLDGLNASNPTTFQSEKPTRGKFIKEGYFDWDNPAHATRDKQNNTIRSAVGVILPPYASYLSERVAAAQQNLPFNIPFWLYTGTHAIGSRQDREKVYYHCQRELIRTNKIGAGYPMLHPDVQKLPDVCPICDSCWDIVWPKVKEHEGNKDSPEYKSYKDGHRQLCPQQRYVFNFLPAGSDVPVLLEAPKTLGEATTNLHYDPMHPDLLWPYAVGQFACCWVQIVRTDLQDTTNYKAIPVYHNQPHVRNQAGAFDEARYLSIIAKMKDLREVSKLYVPDVADTAKAITKRDKVLTFAGIGVARSNMATAEQAIAGVAGASATPPPIAPMPPAPGAAFPVPSSTLPPVPPMPTTASPPPIASPSAPATAAAPSIGSLMATAPPVPAATPPPVVPPTGTPAANNAFDVLQGLLGGSK